VPRRGKGIQTRYSVAIVGDGQTERIYFDNVRDTDRPDNLHIFPDAPRRIGNYKGVLARAIELKEDGYDRVYALIDMDTVISDRQHLGYQVAKTAASAAGVIVLENNPCFEVWLLMLFRYTTKLFNDCDDVTTALREFIPEYNKSERFTVGARLYEKFKDRITANGIPNARRLEAGRNLQDERYPRAQIYELFEWYFSQPFHASSS
jgi:hypothetical protein